MLSYILPILLVFLVGFLAQRTGLCMVRGVQELLAKRPGFLITIICCGFWFWLISPSAEEISFSTPMRRHSVTLPFVLGGFLFGLGAAINKGCSVSTISKLAKGQFHMFATLIGWIIGWCLLASTSVALSYTELSPIQSPSVTVMFILFILIALIMFKIPVNRRPILLGIVLFGIIASLLTSLIPEWAPSQLLKDITAALIHGESSRWPSIQRYLIIASLVLGMALGAKKRLALSEFQLRPVQLGKHLIAGLIMGIGASLALGGNDSQLLIALPSFSPAGAVTIFSMVIGIITGMMLRKAKQRLTQPRAN